MGGAHFSPESPSPSLPKGRELIPAVFEAVVWRSFLLGKAGMGLALLLLPLGEGWDGARGHDGAFLGFCRANKG